MVHLPYGIDASVFTPAEGMKAGGEELTIGYLGRLVPEKGVDLLVRACATLPANVRLRIAGRGPMRDALGSLAVQAGIGERVRITDAVPYADVPAFLRGLDILALPSRPSTIWMEQFGRVLIEAMACGVPVIVSHTSSLPEVVGQAGLMIDPYQPDELYRALREILRDPVLLASLIREGKTQASGFSWSTTADRTCSLFSSLAKGKPKTV